MKALTRITLAVALLCWAVAAHAAGYEDYRDSTTATNYQGICAATGSFNGKTVPRWESGAGWSRPDAMHFQWASGC